MLNIFGKPRRKIRVFVKIETKAGAGFSDEKFVLVCWAPKEASGARSGKAFVFRKPLHVGWEFPR
jgi:hypothetical protein